MLVHKDYRIKVKVTAAKKREIPYSRNFDRQQLRFHRRERWSSRAAWGFRLWQRVEWCNRHLCHV